MRRSREENHRRLRLGTSEGLFNAENVAFRTRLEDPSAPVDPWGSAPTAEMDGITPTNGGQDSVIKLIVLPAVTRGTEPQSGDVPNSTVRQKDPRRDVKRRHVLSLGARLNASHAEMPQ